MTASFSSKDIVGSAESFAAGGTVGLERQISEARRLRLWAEFGLIYVAFPLLMRIAVFDYRVPLFYALPPVLIGFVAFLHFDQSFSLKKELARWPQRR